MKAELSYTQELPAKTIFKLFILGGILLGSVFGVIQLFASTIRLLQ